MAETFSAFDAADYLQTEEQVAAYLEVSAEDGDPADIMAALRTVARARGMSEVARKASLSREGLYKALAEGANPGFATVMQIARALGLAVSFHPQ